MASTPFLHLFLFFFLVTLVSSTFLSNEILEARVLPGRTLLQKKSTCSVDFENQNYTIITSQCKGPNYQPDPCCKSLLELGCPFSDELNDMKSDCATTFFSYINLYGKYPPGLFANMCHGNKQGLDCSTIPDKTPPASSSAAAAAGPPPNSSILIILLFLSLLFTTFSSMYR